MHSLLWINHATSRHGSEERPRDVCGLVDISIMPFDTVHFPAFVYHLGEFWSTAV
jgi:hypothetical protein